MKLSELEKQNKGVFPSYDLCKELDIPISVTELSGFYDEKTYNGITYLTKIKHFFIDPECRSNIIPITDDEWDEWEMITFDDVFIGYSAPQIHEFLEALPKQINGCKITMYFRKKWYAGYDKENCQSAETLVNALALLYLELRKKGFTK
jgi:hypothetical protein